MDLKQKLSANFSLSELIKSETALRNGLDNTPTQEVVDNLRTLCIKCHKNETKILLTKDSSKKKSKIDIEDNIN